MAEGFSTDLGSGKSPGTRTCDKLNPTPVQVTASDSDFARDYHRETTFLVIPTPDKIGGSIGEKSIIDTFELATTSDVPTCGTWYRLCEKIM